MSFNINTREWEFFFLITHCLLYYLILLGSLVQRNVLCIIYASGKILNWKTSNEKKILILFS